MLNEIAHIWESRIPSQESDEDRIILGPSFAEHILKIKNHTLGVSKFKAELDKEKKQLFPLYLNEHQQQKLSTANMIFLIMDKESHYAVYMLDKYMNKVHIIDPHEVSLKEIQEESDANIYNLTNEEADKLFDIFDARKKKRERDTDAYHKHKLKIVPRFKVVFNMVHQRDMETKQKGNWQIKFVEDIPMVDKGESAYAALKLAFLYNGMKFIEDINHFDDGLEICKAEALYMLLLS